MNELIDWRGDAAVVEATAAVERAGVAVGQLDREWREALAAQREAQQVVDELMRGAEQGHGNLSQVNRAKVALATAKERTQKAERESEKAYRTLAACEITVSEVSARARAATWAAHYKAYQDAVKELDQALAGAVEAEERVEQLHGVLAKRFEYSGNGWITAPDGSRIATGMYGTRRLDRANVERWRQWVRENILSDATAKFRQRAAGVADKLRAMAAA